MIMQPFNIYIGWDSKEPEAYDVCKYSIEKHASIPVKIHPLKINALRKDRLYWREEDIGSTEFTISRFLVPHLNKGNGPGLFCDCDFLFTIDIKEIFEQYDPSKAIQVVKHDYNPTESKKFLNNVQYQYPRKNWSSFVLWNCNHPANVEMTLFNVNNAQPSTLHQFKWLKDEMIGELSHEYNWLEGHYKEPEDGSPKVIHYTRGGPWFDDCKDVEYAELWNNYYKELMENQNVKIA